MLKISVRHLLNIYNFKEFHVAYVWIQMANSPRPATWILEHSVNHGKTFQPWQYFASSNSECVKVNIF